jgi:hypothetical protein
MLEIGYFFYQKALKTGRFQGFFGFYTEGVKYILAPKKHNLG